MGLELILPKRASEREGVAFLHSKRDWLQQHVDVIHQAHQQSPQSLPENLNLLFLQRKVPVHYQALRQRKRVKLVEIAGSLSVFGDIAEREKVVVLLRGWLKSQAEQHIVPLLDTLAQRYHLPYKQVTFRNQQTLWGKLQCKAALEFKSKITVFT